MVRWRRPPWVAPTSHGAWLLVVAVALVAGGVLWGVRLVRDAGLLLACLAATSFAAASAGAVVHTVALARRRPRPVGPTHVEAGETARWSLTTDRPGASLPAWVLWRAPEGRWLRALVEGRSDLLLALPRRGSYQIRADGLTFTDPLGLWRVRVPLGEGATVVVLPRPVPVVLPSIDGAAPAGRLRADRGEELAGLRDYRRGDRLSSVHWRQSARLDRLVVVDAERRTRARRTVLLDTRAAAYDDGRADGRPGPAGRRERRSRAATGADVLEWGRPGPAGRRERRSRAATGADVHNAASARADEWSRAATGADVLEWGRPPTGLGRSRAATGANAFETAVGLAAGVLREWESVGADLRLVVGRRILEADAGERGGITRLLEALALAATTPDPPDSGPFEGDAPDVVITAAIALADVGQGLVAPRSSGDLLLVGSAAEARTREAPVSWRIRVVPVGAGLSGPRPGPGATRDGGR